MSTGQESAQGSAGNILLKHPGFPEWHVLQAMMETEEDVGYSPALLPEGRNPAPGDGISEMGPTETCTLLTLASFIPILIELLLCVRHYYRWDTFLNKAKIPTCQSREVENKQ